MDPLERMFRHLVRTIETSFPAYLSRPFEVGELYQTILPYRHHRRELGFETNQDYEMAITQLLAGYGGYLIVDDSVGETLQRELASPNPDPGAFREFAGSQVALAPDAVRRVRGGAPEAPARPSFVAPQPVGAAAGGGSGSESSGSPARSSLGAVGSGTATFSAARTASASASGAGAGGGAGGGASGGGSGASGAGGGSASSGGSGTGGSTSRPSEPAPPLRPSSATAAPRSPTPSTPTGTVRHPTPITVAAGQACRYCGGALPGGRRIVFCPHCGQDLTTVNCQACGTELELGWKFCTTCGRPVASANS